MKLSKLRHATATRHLAGTSVPRQNTTSFGMRAAMKKGGSGYAGEEVEGGSARPRLDRPGRARGGRVNRADGGSTISEDSKSEASRIRDKAESDISSARKQAVGDGIKTGLGAALLIGSRGKFGKAVGAVSGASGVHGTMQGLSKANQVDRDRAEASRIEKGQVTPSEEDRKSGGRVKSKARDDDDCYASGGAIKKGFIKHPGSLRSALGAKEGENIPAKKLEKATHSDNPTLKKRAVLAETMKHWKRG